MHHRRVGLIGADRAEAFLNKAFLLSTQLMQLSLNRTFAHRFFADAGFQPVHQLRHRDAVLEMRTPQVFNLRFILDRLS